MRQKGYRTGLFTSPHLVSVTERIRIDGRPVEQDLFAEHFDFILSQVTKAKEIPPAYFAFLTHGFDINCHMDFLYVIEAEILKMTKAFSPNFEPA